MSRPRKRPRLHFIGSTTPEPNVELELARQRNDNLLKTRWENVFERYEKDFTGIGDEIGIISGQVEVDNGHLRSMQNEKDTGNVPSAASPSQFDGRRMLRAMTVAPTEYSDSIPDADEVLQSIETIADNAMLTDYSSEDDLFDTPLETRSDVTDELSQEYYTDDPYEQDFASQPDLEEPLRSASVDSLFESKPQTRNDGGVKLKSSYGTINISPSISNSIPQGGADDTTIRAEVRRILQEEKNQQIELEEERIEAAWRIPVRLSPSSFPILRVASTDRSPAQALVDVHGEGDLEKHDSVWAASVRNRRSRKEVAAERNLKMIRDESEDPLQEGFTSESETASQSTSTERQQHVKSARPNRNPTSSSLLSSRSQPLGRSSSSQQRSRSPLQHRLYPSSPKIPFHGLSANKRLRQSSSTSSLRDASSELVPDQWTQNRENITRQPPEYGIQPRSSSFSPQDLVSGPNRNASESQDWNSDEESEDDGFISDHSRSQQTRRETGLDKGTSRSIEKRQRNGVADHHPSDNLDTDGTTRTSEKRRVSLPRVSKPETAEDQRNHPWHAPKTRTGKPLGELSKSVRRRNAERYVQDTTQSPSLETSQNNGLRANSPTTQNDPVLTEIEKQKILKPMRKGICYYCKGYHHDKNGVGSHWDRILTNFTVQTLDDDDPHDMAFIHSIRSQVQRRIRPPKTVLPDFRLMVELHERSGMSFEQIATSRLLWSCKNAECLENEYRTYRQPLSPGEPQREWTKKENDRLQAILDEHLVSRKTRITMIRVHRELGRQKNMSFTDLGNKLAGIFLSRFPTTIDPSMDLGQSDIPQGNAESDEPGTNVVPNKHAARNANTPLMEERTVDNNTVNDKVKIETDGDLFQDFPSPQSQHVSDGIGETFAEQPPPPPRRRGRPRKVL